MLLKTHKMLSFEVLNRNFVNRLLHPNQNGKLRSLKKYHLWKENESYTRVFYFNRFGYGVEYVEVGVPGI